MRERTIITGDKAREHHEACIRLVVHGDYESWTRYAILDRQKCAAIAKRLHARGASRMEVIMRALWPEWCERYNGPGRGFSHGPSRLIRNHHTLKKFTSKRFIVVMQMGGLDI